MNHLDTIAAISTPYGKGGIAVIRVSGSGAIGVAEKVFEPKSKKQLSEIDSNRAVYGSIYSSKNGEKSAIDDGIAVIFRAPASFTGEDTVEISCHGGVLLTQRVLEALLYSGARAATAGEFTRRAFINGKMTLTSAEALGELLSASTDEQITLARSGLSGKLSCELSAVYDSLCDILAAIYAKIDYPDEDLADISRDEMLASAEKSLSTLKNLAKTYSTGHAVGEGIQTAIVGRTNVGKSTLYNMIVGRDAAIVTDIEGTTRDILTESAKLGMVTLRLSDTAGLRYTSDRVETIGIERARRTAETAELILAVFDGSRAPDSEDIELCEYLSTLNGTKIAIINKSDLGVTKEMRDLTSVFELAIPFSAKNGDGFSALAQAVEQIYIDKDFDMGNSAIIANARQNSALLSSIDTLSEAISSIQNELPLEVCCVEIENSLSSLGELDGRTVSEDIISKIFANFCVGK